MKIITICGSLRFADEIMRISEELELQGNCVLSVIYPTKDNSQYTLQERTMLGQMHYEKIKLSDAVFVVNPEGYIGAGVKREIEFAQNLGKEIMYLNPQN